MALPIINRLRRSETPAAVPAEQRYAFAAELPGARPDHPLWRMSLEWIERPEGDGERLRIRAHIRTAFGEALSGSRGSLSAETGPASGRALSAVTRRLGAALERGLQQPLVQRLVEPLKHYELNTWFDVQVSTAALDAGTTALLPAPEQLARLGIAPKTDREAPLVESWATPGAGGASFAQVSLLRMAKDRLPESLANLLGSRPFQLAAAVVNVVEPAAAPRERR